MVAVGDEVFRFILNVPDYGGVLVQVGGVELKELLQTIGVGALPLGQNVVD